jgi:hypothetical protein
MAVGTDTAVAAELRVGFWVSDALADCHFFFGECIHCFQLLLWRKPGCRGLLVTLRKNLTVDFGF